MTVGELRNRLEELDDDMPVVTSEYNGGRGGLFGGGAKVVEAGWDEESGQFSELGKGQLVLAIGPRYG